MDKDQNTTDAGGTNSALSGFYNNKGTVLSLFPDKKSRPSLRTFDRWRRHGIIPSIKLGHMRYFNPAAVKAALLARQVGGVR